MFELDKQRIIIIITLLLTTAYSCNNVRNYLVGRENYVECDQKGFVPRPTKSYRKYKKFRRSTGEQELLKLAQSENLALKTYAYWALIEKSEIEYLEIFEKLLQDTSEVVYGCGCTSSSEKISTTTYFNYFITQPPFYSPDGEPLERLKTDEKLYKLDSLIVFSELQEDDLLWYALDHREFTTKEILERIIELAFEKDNEASANYIKDNFDKESFEIYKQQILSLNTEKLTDFGKELFENLKRKGI
mgnify:CR=1 FL=1